MMSISKRIRSIFSLIKKPLLFLIYHPIKLEEISEQLIPGNSEKPIAVLVFFHKWKKQFIADYFPEYNLFYLKRKYHFKFILKWLIQKNVTIIVWGYRDQVYYPELFQESQKIIRVEDAFLRSTNLGKAHAKPLSLAIDSTGLYYNSTTASDLENLLNHYDFSPREIEQAKQAILLIKKLGISKYNHAPKIKLSSIIGPKTKKRILVIGQVEKDASIKYGCNKKLTNYDLLKLAYEENPNCEIIYKIHPDVLAYGHFSRQSLKKVSKLCTVVSMQMSPASLFEETDKVYTLTSLMGFEALLHGIPVVCVGAPFYSNWGLTDDRLIIQRRTRKRTLEEVFIAAYILYPHYPYGDLISTIFRLSKSSKTEIPTLPI
jgi:capsular polysaccharide export protein